MKRIHIFLFFLIVATALGAQELTIQAPSQVSVGQGFRITFQVNAKPQGDIRVNSFGDLEVISGPMTGSSSSMSIINGQVSHSVSVSAQYVVRATQEGTTTIGPAACTVDGKTIRCQPVTIKVVKGNTNMSTTSQQPTQQGTNIDDKKLFARVSVSNSKPYKGEEVIITYKIYTQLSLRQYSIDKLPGIKGFWSEDLTGNGDIRRSEETINGQRYAVAEIRRGAIYGQEVGTQTIDPLQLDVQAMVPVQRRRATNWIEAFFDDPFFNQAQSVEKHVTSNALKVNVKPLPQVPQGKVFSGGVGNFKVKPSVDQTEVKANEAITYRLTVSGKGNLVLLDAPQVEFSKVFEVYEPKVSDAISRTTGGVSGSRTFEWVIIPQSPGTYTLPAIEYTWFNPKTGKYETAQTEKFDIKVAKGNTTDHLVGGGQSDVKQLNSDINHIKAAPGRLRRNANSISPLQWTLLVLPILASLLLILLGRKRQEMLSDESTLRQHRALKLARKRLRTAEKYLNEGSDSQFYEEIYKALWGCLSDKYSIPISQLNRDSVSERLTEVHIGEEQLALIMDTLKAVDEARFAPIDSGAHKHDIYNKTLNTIAAI